MPAPDTAPPTVVPPDALLPPVVPTQRISAGVHPVVAWRRDLRRVPNARNVVSVAALWAETAATVAAYVWITGRFPAPWVTAVAFVVVFALMGRAHCRFAILMHEAAHRLLFSNRRVNDLVGRWLLAYPTFVPFDLYRGGHLAHHRDELGPEEPDIPLYRGYPVTPQSLRRKLVRDATGRTGLKLHKGLVRACVSELPAARRVAWSIVATQVVIAALFAVAGHPWLYLLLWFLPHLTVWRVLNRLRSIAEHGGMAHDPDKRRSTHTVRQHPWARFWIVPYHTGWHLAHHVDPGIPHARLPELHAALKDAGWIPDGLESPTYTALWRRLASRPVAQGTGRAAAQ
jgi:fatty acid desaturase